MNNKTNTAQGTEVENRFADSIFKQPVALNNMLESIGYDEAIGKDAWISVIGGAKRKTDVVIDFGDAIELAPVRVTIKSFSGGGYNQIGRQKLPAFCTRNQINKTDQDFLEKLILRKADAAEKGDKKRALVDKREQARIREIFEDIEPGISSIRGNDYPQVLALYSVDLKKFHLYNICQQVEPLISGRTISFTAPGGNIQFGDYVAIQRKAGDKSKKFSLDDIRHPANEVQIKMWVKKFFDRVEPVASYVYPAP